MYVVGGTVRDLLLGGTPKDYDILSSAELHQASGGCWQLPVWVIRLEFAVSAELHQASSGGEAVAVAAAVVWRHPVVWRTCCTCPCFWR